MSIEFSPVFWAQFGRASWRLARLLPTLPPPLLVMSTPRSGSSWVGEMLGSADNALYLREPLTQATIDFGLQWWQVKLDPANLPGAFKRYADAAFGALPIFHSRVVAFPDQWRLSQRRYRRLIVKEVNLTAFDMLAQYYKPRLILLVRHPASVALSYKRLGWLGPGSKALEAHGRQQASRLQLVWGRLQSYSDHRVVLYEDICIDPIGWYKKLYEFGGLKWTARAEQIVGQHSEGGDRRDTYGTYRDSQNLKSAWREAMPADDLKTLRDIFTASDLPWYRSDDEW